MLSLRTLSSMYSYKVCCRRNAVHPEPDSGLTGFTPSLICDIIIHKAYSTTSVNIIRRHSSIHTAVANQQIKQSKHAGVCLSLQLHTCKLNCTAVEHDTQRCSRSVLSCATHLLTDTDQTPSRSAVQSLRSFRHTCLPTTSVHAIICV